MHPVILKFALLCGIAIIAIDLNVAKAKDPTARVRAKTDDRYQTRGIPDHGVNEWRVFPCRPERICKLDLLVTVNNQGRCSVPGLPDVIDAHPGNLGDPTSKTRVVRWKVSSVNPAAYRVRIERVVFDSPGDGDVEDDPDNPNDEEKWFKRYRANTLKFLTYDIYLGYKRTGQAWQSCSNSPFGPAITNRG